MNNKKLETALNEYIVDPHAEGAFYIDGSWGCGKTYFIKGFSERINEQNPKKPRSVYVSLNGMKSVGDISNAIFSACHPRLTKAKNSAVLKIASSAINVASIPWVDTNALNKFLEGLLNFWKNKNAILILDDFERCRIDLQELFGFISALLEDHKTKVIIVGNDVEVIRYLQSEQMHRNRLIAAILSKDGTSGFFKKVEEISEPTLYHSIKEKVFYQSYFFPFDSSVFFESICPSFDERSKTAILRNREALESVFKYYECENLRTCKVAEKNFLKVINAVFEKTPQIDRETEDSILLSVFIYTILYKNGKEEKEFESRRALVGRSIFPNQPIADYVFKGAWNQETIVRSVQAVSSEITAANNKNMPDYLKEITEEPWVYQDEEKLVENMHTLVDAIDNNTLPLSFAVKALLEMNAFKEVFQEQCFFDVNEKKNTMLAHIKTSKEKIEFEEDIWLINSRSDKIEGPVGELMAALRKKNFDISGNALFKKLKVGPLSQGEEKGLADEARENRCFLANIGADEFIRFIKSANPSQITNLRKVLQNVYSFNNLNDFFAADVGSLKQITGFVLTYETSSKLTMLAIQYLKEDLLEYCRRFYIPENSIPQRDPK